MTEDSLPWQSTFFKEGSELRFQTSGSDSNNSSSLSCQLLTGASDKALVMPADQCVIPKGLNGPCAVFLTGDDTPLAGNVAAQDGSKIVAGPGMIFVDSKTGSEVLDGVRRPCFSFLECTL